MSSLCSDLLGSSSVPSMLGWYLLFSEYSDDNDTEYVGSKNEDKRIYIGSEKYQ